MMSKKQWGHGFNQGRNFAYQEMIGYLKAIRKDFPDAHLVHVRYYGSEGIEPIDPSLCPYAGEHSCQSGGGGIICGWLAGAPPYGDYVTCYSPHIGIDMESAA